MAKPPRPPTHRAGHHLADPELEAKYASQLRPARCGYSQVGMTSPPPLSRDFVLRGPVHFIEQLPLDELLCFEPKILRQLLADHAALTRIPWWSAVMATERNGLDPLASQVSWCRMRLKEIETFDAPPNLVGCYHHVRNYWWGRKRIADLVWRGGNQRYADGRPRQARASRTILDRRIYLDMLDGFSPAADRAQHRAERIAATAEQRAADAAHKAAARAMGNMKAAPTFKGKPLGRPRLHPLAAPRPDPKPWDPDFPAEVAPGGSNERPLVRRRLR